MLSYEDIFMRHNTRPLSYLTRNLDSPVTHRRTSAVLRSPVLYKDRRPRPISFTALDSITNNVYDGRRLTTPIPSLSTDKPLKNCKDSYRLSNLTSSSADSTARNCRDSYRFITSPLTDNIPKNCRNNYRLPATISSSSIDTIPRNCKDNYRLSIPISCSLEQSKTKNSNDNYRLAATFSERHLSRRELPLCTIDELLDIIREPTGYYALPKDPWNEVYPDIFISDAPTALCTTVLKRIGITHVLNAAQGKEKSCGQVNTWPGFYSQSGIQFLGVPAFDNIVFRIYPYFEEAAQFIEDGLKTKGKVLVHCRMGISRSATLVCAFLMMKRGLTVQEAVRRVRKNREIIPNDGFLQQLCDLNDKLKRRK